MVVSILIFLVVAIVALGAVALFLNDGRTLGENGRWVKDSVEAWREGELENDIYEVEVHDAGVNDVFNSFEQASGNGYLSLQEVGSTLKPVTDPFARMKLSQKVGAV